jgi:hypothetical protein
VIAIHPAFIAHRHGCRVVDARFFPLFRHVVFAFGILLAALCFAGPASAADEIHWTITGQTSVTFDWRGTSAENTIRYGTSSGVYTGTVTAVTPSPVPDSSPGPFWEARIPGLAQNTLYYYRIGTNAEHTFRTPPPRGGSGFWIAEEADIGSSDDWANVTTTQAMINVDSPAIAGDDRPRFVLAPGDLTYGDQSGPSVVDIHFNDVMPWSQDVAYMPAWGNHEDGSSLDDRQNYEGRFDFPNSQDSPNAPSTGGPGEEWYWFDYGNARFISYPEPFSGAWSDWRTKADPIMAAAQSDPAIQFIITYGHRPPWSSGADHGGDGTLAGYMRDLHVKYAKYVMNIGAHSHHYERSHPAMTDGILHIIGPGGGSSLGGIASTQPAWSAYRTNHLQHIRMYFAADRIDGYVVCGPAGSGSTDTCTQGAVIDTWTIAAPGGPPPPSDTIPPASITNIQVRN